MSNDMFQKDQPEGPVGVMDNPGEFKGVDGASMEDRSHLSPENDKPWSPLEEATDEQIEEWIGNLDEDKELEKYVGIYQDGILHMQAILADCKNSSSDTKEKNYSDLKKINEYFDKFHRDLKDKKGMDYYDKFLDVVDDSLIQRGINRKELLIEATKEYARKLAEDEALRRMRSVTREVEKKAEKPAPVERAKGIFGIFGRR